MTDLDVVIVGAGISGLAVANGLTSAGKSVRVFEARDRLGGRIHSVDVPGGRADLGPTWFWPGEHRVDRLVSDFGLGIHDQWTAGDALFAVEGTTHRVTSPPMPRSHRFTNGAGALIDGLADRLPVQTVALGTAVTRLEPHPDGVTVHLDAESVTAQHAVVALPPALALRRGLIQGDDLHPEVRQVATAIPTWMGGVSKVVVVYPESFWRQAGLSGLVSAPGHVFSEIHDMSGPDGTPAMLFGFGQPSNGTASIEAQFVSRLEELFGPAAGDPIHVDSVDWRREEFTSAGAIPSQGYDLFGSPMLQQPSWNGTLYWSSTETSSVAPGHIEGALAAAERVVGQLTTGLR